MSDATTTFRELPFMGVIRVNVEAMKHGFRMGDSTWSNLGQGQPEVGAMEGAPERFRHLEIDPGDHAYGAVEGVPELREAVAEHYNRLFRKGKASRYTAENVAVASGGRTALTRAGAALASRLGYFTPDYTAYEDLLDAFERIRPEHIELKASEGFRIEPRRLDGIVAEKRVQGLLISNPCNPTGVVVRDAELAAWVEMSRKRGVTLLMDEFYSHYIYGAADRPVSAAEFVEDVDRDPVVIFDGLTKCFRYPGWRVGWVVAPKQVIRNLTAAGSFVDGGPSRPIQRAAIQVLEPARADQETGAVRRVFAKKRAMAYSRLREMGVEFYGDMENAGTFYLWGSVAKLPRALNTGQKFMQEGFKHRVSTVPGEYFDVNPGKRRGGASPLEQFVRFSFGPPEENVRAGLDRLAEMVRRAK